MRRRDLLSMKDLLFLSGILMAFVWSLGTGYAEQTTSYTAYIEASRDNTLIEDPEGDVSNGAGPFFFAGNTNQEITSNRRGVIFFDVAAEIPGEAIIESVSLTLYQLQGNPVKSEVSLYRLLNDWGEGASASAGGSGAPAQAGDATWLYTFYDQEFWEHEGGSFIRRMSASQYVEGNGYYSWESTNHLVQDVRLWVREPVRNFGWIVINDESLSQNAKRFASRENMNSNWRPLLAITYRLPL